MIKKQIYLLLTITLITLTYNSTILGSTFDFSQELNQASNLTETLDRIAAYKNIIKHIDKNDSNRLVKKFIKLIKNLHTICCDENDIKIKFEYKNLLKAAVFNEKLAFVDYTNDLASLLDQYEKQEMFEKKEELHTTTQPINHAVAPASDVTIGAESKPSIDVTQLCKNVCNLDLNKIMSQLSLRKLIDDVTKLSRDFESIEGKVSKLSEQNNLLSKIYQKLLTLEQANLPAFFDPNE